jgi:hypothetical protein
MKSFLNSITIILIIVMLSSCKKNDDVLSPKPSKSIYGVAILKHGNDNALNSSGINVNVEGTSIATYTDSTGIYRFDNVEYGNQCFVYSKPGYGVYKRYENVSDSTTPNLNGILLFRLPANKVSTISIQYVNDTLSVVGTVSSYEPFSRGIILFISKDSIISSDPTKHLFSLNEYNAPIDSTNFSIRILKSDFTSKGINSGDKIYLVAYTAVLYSFSFREYLDKNSGKLLYNGLGNEPSKIVSIQLR